MFFPTTRQFIPLALFGADDSWLPPTPARRPSPRQLRRVAAVCFAAAAVVLALLLSGCASMPAGQRAMIAAVAADSATTAYGLTQTDLREVGTVHGSWEDDDAALVSAIAVDALLVWGLHRLWKRHPEWTGWPSVWWAVAGMKGGVAVKNVGTIRDAD